MTSLYWLQCGGCGGDTMSLLNAIEGVPIEPPKGVSRAHYWVYNNEIQWGAYEKPSFNSWARMRW